jgi:hypothetical protein
MSTEEYCELCELPRSQCIHGNPPAPPPPRATPAPRATPIRRTRVAAPTKTSAPVTRRWTPPEAFKAPIVAVLGEHGGAMEQDALFDALEAWMAERISDADRETTPEGELRWRYAARRARQALIAEGAMTKGLPGIWSLAN